MKDLYSKIYGCFLGKNIGGTLGMPYEGAETFLSLDYYLPVPTKPLPNDDVDLQLVWFEAFKSKGVALTSEDLAGYWLRHIDAHYDEYGIALWNIKRGLKPPLTGIHNNAFKHGMGSAIRSEIWAALFPERPLTAAYYAWLDSSVDHWDEGVYSEVFLAAAQSHLYGSRDIRASLDFALGLLPSCSTLKRAISAVMALYDSKTPYEDARERVMKLYGDVNFTDCVMNLSIIALGLLYGEGDFGKSILLAVNCGQDADCTGATTGAFLGILLGKDGIPERWSSKVGAVFAVGDYIKGIKVHCDLDAFARDIVAQHPVAAKATKEIAVPFALPQVEDFSDRNPWLVQGEPVVFDGFKLDSSLYSKHLGEEIHFKTSVSFDCDGEVQLMAASTALFRCYWNGKFIGSKGDQAKPVPAMHRVRGGRCFTLEVAKGRSYELEIAMVPTAPVPDLYVAFGDMACRHVKTVYKTPQ